MDGDEILSAVSRLVVLMNELGYNGIVIVPVRAFNPATDITTCVGYWVTCSGPSPGAKICGNAMADQNLASWRGEGMDVWRRKLSDRPSSAS